MFKNKIFKISLIGLLILLVVFSVYTFSFRKINQRRKTLKLQLERLNNEMQYIKKENMELKEGVFNSSKNEFLEKEARLNSGYKKEGETAVILSSGTTTTKAKNTNDGSFFEKIKN